MNLLRNTWHQAKHVKPDWLDLLTVLSSLVLAGAILFVEKTKDLTLDWKSALITVSYALLTWVSVTMVSRKPRFSFLLTSWFILILVIISKTKHKYLKSNLHAYDVFYYSTHQDEFVFIYELFPHFIYISIAVLVLSAIAFWFIYRFDRTIWKPKALIAIGSLSLVLLALTLYMRGQKSSIYHEANRYHSSSFFFSLPEAISTVFRGGMFTHGDFRRSPTPAPQASDVSIKKPNIIAVLHEAVMPLDSQPRIQPSSMAKALFLSGDQKIRSLEVETFGGATWLSEYGFILGISTHYFGSMKHFLGKFMVGKIRTSLALELKQSGYRTIAVYPSPGTYMSTRKIYKSIGFDEVLDADDLQAETQRERDAFYYRKVLDLIESNEKDAAAAPVFIFVWTMATHSPYDEQILPELKDFDNIHASSNSWREYTRRVHIAEKDYLSFVTELKETTSRPTMVIGFGDHQPNIANQFLNPDLKYFGTEEDNGPKGFTTFYRVQGVNFEPNYSAFPGKLDITYLSTALLDSLNLPMSETFLRRKSLMTLCEGKFARCADQESVLGFNG